MGAVAIALAKSPSDQQQCRDVDGLLQLLFLEMYLRLQKFNSGLGALQ